MLHLLLIGFLPGRIGGRGASQAAAEVGSAARLLYGAPLCRHRAIYRCESGSKLNQGPFQLPAGNQGILLAVSRTRQTGRLIS